MQSQRRPSCPVLNDREGISSTRFPINRVDVDLPQPSPSEQLLARLLARALKAFPESHFKRPLVRAARDAARMAEMTGYALLLLPELFMELAVAEMLKAEYYRMGRI